MKAVILLCALFCVALSVVHKAHPCNFAENCGVHDMKRIAKADGSRMHTIKIHLRQNDFGAACPTMLEDISDPNSANYGRHLTFEQVRKLVWDQEAIDAVHNFLAEHHIPADHTELAPNGEFIKVKAPIAKLEKMFDSEFHHFASVSRKAQIIRAESYTIPQHVAPFIQVINGIKNFPVYSKHAKIGGLIRGPIADGSVTPELIWKTYNMPNETDATPLADQAVFEALGQSYSPDDLKQFQTQYNIPVQDIKTVIGPNDPSQCSSNPDNCGEANLDVQYIMAMAQGAPTIYWSIADENGDIFLDFVEEVAKDANPPQVFSISYGGPEHLQDVNDMIRFNTEACKMGLRGLTLFASSGDDGVAGYEARGNPSQCGFKPQYPANCPYITVVGATMGPESGKPESACQSDTGSIITTGGGFSNLFGRPRYQRSTVQHYLDTAANLPPTSMFNTTGRAYPDVAALGNAYHVIIGGNDYQVSGTSASAPVFCAMVTLVNGDREVQGKSTIGFFNPLLYALKSSIFHDITVGNNKCCAGGDGAPTCCQYGFSCAKGWDPVTGRGSIDFDLFANYLVGQK